MKMPANEENLFLPEEYGCGEIILHLSGDSEAIQGKEVVFLGERNGVFETRIVEVDQSGDVHAYLPLSFHWVYRIGNVTGLILFDRNNRSVRLTPSGTVFIAMWCRGVAELTASTVT